MNTCIYIAPYCVAGARLWNRLPHDIIASDTLSRFHRELTTFLFRQSYPSSLFFLVCLCGPCSFYLGHVKNF